MKKKAEPWYLHAGLWVVIIILTVVLVQVAILEPTEITRQENYFKSESRLRMTNLKQAEILYENQYVHNFDLPYYIYWISFHSLI